MNSACKRHILFLQGMPSLFFYRIAQKLEEHGCRCTRINLCAGDRLFWPGKNAISYRGSLAEWPLFIRNFFQKEKVTDLVLLGEQRRYHREAVAIAQELGIQVTVTDFGYIRPDWITWERNGMTGNSLFPRDPAVIRTLAQSAPKMDWRPRFVDGPAVMAKGDLAYNYANLLGKFFYPRYRRSDLRPPTLPYTVASGIRLLGNRLQKAKVQAKVQELVQSGASYFLFPLQLNFDFQIVAYSPYQRMEDVVRVVMGSFAAHAAPRDLLILKEHPWDPALPNWEKFAYREARSLGILDRIAYLRGGHLDTLVSHARGVVLVNSSTGIRALQLRRPLKPLGQAIYDIEGLTHQGSLESFWRKPQLPDWDLAEDFLRVLAATVQIRGVFFQEEGLECAVQEAFERLFYQTVGELHPFAKQAVSTPNCDRESARATEALAKS